jgi:Chaperone of endosialidase
VAGLGLPSNYVAKSGDTMTGALALPAGSNAAPSLNFGNTYGVYFTGSGVGIAVNGVLRMTIGGTIASTVSYKSNDGLLASPVYSFSAESGSGIYRKGAGHVSMAALGADIMSWNNSSKVTTAYGPILLPADPTSNLHAATKQYVDNKVAAGGGGVTQAYVDSADALRVLKAGDTMTGVLNITDTTNTVNPATGALTVAGGAGIGADLQVFNNATVGNLLTAGGAITAGSYIQAGSYIKTGPTNGYFLGSEIALIKESGFTNLYDGTSPCIQLFTAQKSIFYNSDTHSFRSYNGGVYFGTWDAYKLYIQNTTASTAPTDGALVVAGGVGVGGNVNVGGDLAVTNTAASSSPTTGALTVAGGVGVGGDINAGGHVFNLGFDVTTTASGQNGVRFTTWTDGINYLDLKSIASGRTIIRCGAGAEAGSARSAMEILHANGQINLPATTASSSPTTGALTVAGGVGVGGDLYTPGFTLQGTVTPNLVWRPTSGATSNFQIYQNANTAVLSSTTVGPALVIDLPTCQVNIPQGIASTSPTAGALTVAGGVGIGGDINGAGRLTLTSAAGDACVTAKSTKTDSGTGYYKSISSNTAAPRDWWFGVNIANNDGSFQLWDNTAGALRLAVNTAGTISASAGYVGTRIDLNGATPVVQCNATGGNYAGLMAYSNGTNYFDVIGGLQVRTGPTGLSYNVFNVDKNSGNVAFQATGASSSPTTGALTVAGGLGVGAELHAAGVYSEQGGGYGTFYFVDNSHTKYLQYTPGLPGFSLNGGKLNISDTTASSSPTSGALTVAGGIGCNDSINVAGNIAGAGANVGSSPGMGNTNQGYSLWSNGAVHVSAPNQGYAENLNANVDCGIVRYCRSGTQVGYVYVTTTGTTYSTTSDGRSKTDFRSFDAGPIIDAIRVHDFAWRETGKRSFGVVAQEVVEVFPQAVSHIDDGDYWGTDYSQFVPLLLQEIKDLRARVAQLEAQKGRDAPWPN